MTSTISASGGAVLRPGLGRVTTPSKARPNQYAVTARATSDITANLFTHGYFMAGTTASDAAPATVADLTVGDEDSTVNFMPVLTVNTTTGTVVTGRSRQLDLSPLTLGKKVWLAWISMTGGSPVGTDPVVASCNLGTLRA